MAKVRAEMLLEDRVAIITGAGGGLGREICLLFAARGARIVAFDRASEAGNALIDDLQEAGARNPLLMTGDVRSSAEVAASFDQLANRAGRIDILVNCAGVREMKAALDLPAFEWDDVIAINLSGTFYCCQAAARWMSRNSGGAIVNISSVAGVIGLPRRPAYTASKHGVVGLTKNLAKDLAQFNIRVNAIAPGTIRTPLTESHFHDEAYLRSLSQVVPLGTAGTPQDVAQAALFLASDMSSFVTGVVLPVDGGWLAEKGYRYGMEGK